MDPATATTLTKLGIQLLPGAASGVANIFNKDQKTATEAALYEQAQDYKQESEAPINTNEYFQSGKAILDSQDQKNRRAVNNQSAINNATDEAKIASKQSANEAYNQQLQRLFQGAQRFREQQKQRYLNTAMAAGQLTNQRRKGYADKMNSITGPLSKAMNAFTQTDVIDGWFADKPADPEKVNKDLSEQNMIGVGNANGGFIA